MPRVGSKVNEKGSGQEPLVGEKGHSFVGGHAIMGKVEEGIKGRKRSRSCTWKIIVCSFVIIIIMLLGGLMFSLASYLTAQDSSISSDWDTPFFRGSGPRCGYLRPVSFRRNSTYVKPLDAVNQTGTRCMWLVFSDTKEVEISYANQSLDYLENSGAVVGEIDGDGINCRKLEPGSRLVAKTPLILSFSSESYISMRHIRFELSPVHANDSDEKAFPGGGMMTINVKKGRYPLRLSNDTNFMLDFVMLFDFPTADDTAVDLRCSPIGTQCCESVSVYRIPTYPNEGSCHKLRGLNSFPGEASSSGDPIFFFFGRNKNVQNETNCEFSWAPSVQPGFA